MSEVMWSGKVNIGILANIGRIKSLHGLVSPTLFYQSDSNYTKWYAWPLAVMS